MSACGLPERPQQVAADDFSCHPGHRIYVGGRMDGDIAHLVFASPSDYPLCSRTARYDGRYRDEYERDIDGGAHCVYRFTRTIDYAKAEDR